jgi:hypothetical protein
MKELALDSFSWQIYNHLRSYEEHIDRTTNTNGYIRPKIFVGILMGMHDT